MLEQLAGGGLAVCRPGFKLSARTDANRFRSDLNAAAVNANTIPCLFTSCAQFSHDLFAFTFMFLTTVRVGWLKGLGATAKTALTDSFF